MREPKKPRVSLQDSNCVLICSPRIRPNNCRLLSDIGAARAAFRQHDPRACYLMERAALSFSSFPASLISGLKSPASRSMRRPSSGRFLGPIDQIVIGGLTVCTASSAMASAKLGLHVRVACGRWGWRHEWAASKVRFCESGKRLRPGSVGCRVCHSACGSQSVRLVRST